MRLVYADWLEENDDPAQANFIRNQVFHPDWFDDDKWFGSPIPYPEDYLLALDWLKAGPADESLHAICGGHCRGSDGRYVWWRETAGGNSGTIAARWSRGFIEYAECSAADWLCHAYRLTDTQPVTRVRLTTLPDIEPSDWYLSPAASIVTLAGNARTTVALPAEEREVVVWRLLTAEWPGIVFEFMTAGGRTP